MHCDKIVFFLGSGSLYTHPGQLCESLMFFGQQWRCTTYRNKIYQTLETQHNNLYIRPCPYSFLFPFVGLFLFIDLHPRVKTEVEVWMQQVVCWLLCLGTAAALAVLQKDQVAQHAIKLYRTKGATHGHSWVASNCKRLVGLLRQKNVVVKKLAAAADAVGRDRTLSDPERHFQVPETWN